MSSYVLYGSQASYFTGKARGYLNWKGVSFEEKAVNEEIMKDIILANVGWPVIPVMKTPDRRIIQDTVDIIAEIEAVHGKTSVMPDGPVQRFVSQLLHVFGDEWLLLPAMHYRWNYNEEWIYSEFGKSTAPDASPEDQYAIGKKRGQYFRGSVPLLGISEETAPGIEASYEAFLSEFSSHLEQHPFLFGDRPTLADFAFLGPLHAHLYRDPASGEIMKRLAPRVAAWTERTHAGQSVSDALIGGDAIPETLEPLMRRHLTEHLPVLQATNGMFEAWAGSAEPQADLPRAFDMTPFSVEGVNGSMISRTFSLLRLQTALDELANMDADAKARAHALLERVGGAVLIDFEIKPRLTRRKFRLALA